ncbi:type I methionyl aminopeptidase [Sporolactobacillus inulinus]|uniref:Methionine aminopeptidase n=1 Tax=Sporolactobacillus inulinus CASD TaxID=1069536 RepID=A0A0U1QR93_9BACL|nr:type I methionyl aminopeptidase [Sporolactobacillus inulinus]KLI03321.1 methionine aminopeptidase [Sporolactobacillus inulinus CASD]GEB77638.1 methionine aminopeptidase 1 [Sporolactobacillus inulinus]
MITRKTIDEVNRIRMAGKIVGHTLGCLQQAICPGISTIELDALAERLIRDAGAEPSFKGYDGYSNSICTSVNDQLAHGIPGSYVLQDGDIISIDIGAKYEDFHADSAWTFPVGKPSDAARKLLETTEESLNLGIAEAKPGSRLSTISHAIQRCAESKGFSVVRELTGHGVGRELHEDPDIPNYGRPGRGPVLEPGMVLAIEPLINEGSRKIWMVEDDDWTLMTQDGKNCAHFEHTIVITENGNEILTKQ